MCVIAYMVIFTCCFAFNFEVKKEKSTSPGTSYLFLVSRIYVPFSSSQDTVSTLSKLKYVTRYRKHVIKAEICERVSLFLFHSI